MNIGEPDSESDMDFFDCEIGETEDEMHMDTTKDSEERAFTGRNSGSSHATHATSDTVMAGRVDLLDSVTGMYRILDLVNERGSDGTVAKVIIAQDSLKRFINDVKPGAHMSSTKINFKALDTLSIKPIGVYGSKEAIAELLFSIGAVSRETAQSLTSTSGDMFEPLLRSGLYVVRSRLEQDSAHQLFVIYWPEHATWDDNAVTSVCRNRVTFMRYLTKITDQVIAVISPEHAKAIIWQKNVADDDMDVDNGDEADRLFTFEISQTNEQEENVTARDGFKIPLPYLTPYKPPADCLVDAITFTPKLVGGDTVQGLLEATYVTNHYTTETVSGFYTQTRLHALFDKGEIHLSPFLNHATIDILVGRALKPRFLQECEAWERQLTEFRNEREQTRTAKLDEMTASLDAEFPRIQATLVSVISERILELYPELTLENLGTHIPEGIDYKGHFQQLQAIPEFAEGYKRMMHDAKLERIDCQVYRQNKRRILGVTHVVENLSAQGDHHNVLVQHILDDNLGGAVEIIQSLKGGAFDKLKSFVSWLSRGSASPVVRFQSELQKRANAMTDSEFISSLSEMVIQEPLLQPAASDAISAAHSYFAKAIPKHCHMASHRARSAQENQVKVQFDRELNTIFDQKQDTAKRELIQKIAMTSRSDSSPFKTTIQSIEVTGHVANFPKNYRITGTQDRLIKPTVEYKLKTLELSSDDQERLRMDKRYIPHPRIDDSERRSHSFRIPWDHNILYIYLLMNDRCLLILGDKQGNVLFYCDKLSSLENAVRNQRPRKMLHRDKIGQDFLIAFDETKRMLAVCSSAKLQLHIFVFDEIFTTLNAPGTAFNLTTWYPPATCICYICFVYGSDEVFLVDSSMRGRIFSTITQQFRPASLSFEQIPSEIYSSPDGSCLFTRNESDSEEYLTAYHWNTFGSSPGITVPLPRFGADMVLSSLLNRTNVHLVMLDAQARQCRSLALDISSRVTQFSFNEKGSNRVFDHRPNTTLNSHNSLIDCHADVWTRFPVQPAIQRQTITASSQRHPRSITFITDRDHDAFVPHFNELISTFERTTRKPTGAELKNIVVTTLEFNQSLIELAKDCNWPVSCFKAGEWLVDILCLIPIQIAVTRENRFIPLKDGVYSAQFEKSLLGADVNTIVNDLSFGWYESIFQSYMATKPVKVVSSMGEQSVGKSYTLNHLADTSFAGSAMRTTEGVWMSVAPTEACLVVALDFEGVDSLERSVQEDTFLVLFNTAISNLVLFRNNFAFSRDIKGLFQSFQSSCTVLNPAANPSLFQSTLVIIIKDVVDSDMMEIKREFQSKFQQIVQEEQDGNFITRLHGGKLIIIPWPVIASPQFYTLFPVIARRLEQQKPTHPSAGAFLYTLKTLMAKLKANDWGALSQTLVAHRAQCLLDQLPNALAFGLSEIEPQSEPLKNFDTDEVVDAPDTISRFQLSEAGRNQAERESRLTGLIQSWDLQNTRHHQGEDQWTVGLEEYLSHLVDMRIVHVTEWISSNLSRFQTEHANVEALRRTFESSVVDLKANILICKLQCQSCHLSCLRIRHHDGSHDCQTNHECIHPCDFLEDHGSELSVVKCGFSAGHSGRHICVVNTHLCGEPCMFSGRPGCLQNCTKMIGHTEMDHACSSTSHACGQPCDLREADTTRGQKYTCAGTCVVPIDDPHDHHQCHERQCPITCQLCRRLCAAQDHLHGLEGDAVHLCGQTHSCKANCSENGVCEIETAPHSIEATFTGTHETFQYTKYTQVKKRLPCAIPIGAGDISHPGPHRHGEEQNLFHFCTTRCDDCGYYCTLPLGHTQPTHETSHGSMSRTQWVIEGPAGTVLELNNRKFGVADEGAPMMCNMVCQSMGRHVHIDYCRATADAPCRDAEIQHITTQMPPNPERPKDLITHSLFWRRSGFKDPYSRDDQATFAKCDAMCPGQEHTATPADRSYCTLPLFHDPHPISRPSGMGYISIDGHSFSCKNPAQLQQSFHVIFVIDRSGSMGYSDRSPLQNTPVTARIAARSNNRLGAVYSSLHGFWSSRQGTLSQSSSSSQQPQIRRDAYSVLLFDHGVTTCLANDFTSTPDQLLNAVLVHSTGGGTNYTSALKAAQAVMVTHWSSERTPVIIFLSDGECSVEDQTVQDVCRAAVARGKPLSLHSVSFGPQASSTYLRRMAQIALESQNNAPPDPLQPATAVVLSSYSEALDTVRLAETFLGFAEALVKPRGALLRKA